MTDDISADEFSQIKNEVKELSIQVTTLQVASGKLPASYIGTMATLLVVILSGVMWLINSQVDPIRSQIERLDSDHEDEARRLASSVLNHETTGHPEIDAALKALEALENSSMEIKTLVTSSARFDQRMKFLEKSTRPFVQTDSKISQVATTAERALLAVADLHKKMDHLKNNMLGSREIDSLFKAVIQKEQSERELIQLKLDDATKRIRRLELINDHAKYPK